MTAGYLEIAAGEVGYRGNPENVTKYWAALAPSLQGQPWCAAFVSWCLREAGQLDAIGGSPMYSCIAMVNKARARGQWSGSPRDGALAIYDFGSGTPAHVEFVVSSGTGSIEAIGGNTSGDVVARKTRSTSLVLGYWHIDAVPGSIPPGSGGAGPGGGISAGTWVEAPAQTLAGEPAGGDVTFTGRRVISTL